MADLRARTMELGMAIDYEDQDCNIVELNVSN
jgi:hypothetical protein